MRLTGCARERHSNHDPVIVDHMVTLCGNCLKLRKYSDVEIHRTDWNEVYRVGGDHVAPEPR